MSADDVLRHYLPFRGLADLHREQLAAHLVRHEFPIDAAIIREGAKVDALHLIESGSVGMFTHDVHSGILQLVQTFEPGEAVGEIPLLSADTTFSYVAIEPTVTYRMGVDIFMAVASQIPDVAFGLARNMAARIGRITADGSVPWTRLQGRTFDAKLWSIAPDKILRQGRIVPLEMRKKTLAVAVADPQSLAGIDRLSESLPGVKLRVFASNPEEWNRFVEQGTKGIPASKDGKAAPKAQATPPKISFVDEEAPQTARSQVNVMGPNVVEYVNEIVATALMEGASDIHIEPDRRGVLVRYRIDGALRARPNLLPSEVGRPLASRLKLLGRLDIAETRKAQEGRISVRVDNRLVDLRVSCIPAKLGEKIVMRILDPESNILDLQAIFSVDKVRQVFSRLISRPHGLVLITGPTGSGKTTTLYSSLHARRAPELNVVTVEDPIEYHMDGITQVQVQAEMGNTFAAILRALLRQDPDIIMIGEMRDAETAQIGVEAAMTGHLVLTSAHANGAAESVIRLTNLGVDRIAVANNLVGVLHQRLVRRICTGCSEPTEYPEAVVETLQRVGAIAPKAAYTFRRGKGCARCANTGFKGRVGVYELLPVSNPVREAIIAGGDARAIHEAGNQGGAVDLARYAGYLVETGMTAPSEVLHLLERGDQA